MESTSTTVGVGRGELSVGRGTWSGRDDVRAVRWRVDAVNTAAAVPYWKPKTSGKTTTTTHIHTRYTGRYDVCHRSRGPKATRLPRNFA